MINFLENNGNSEEGLDPSLWIAFAGVLVKTLKIGKNVFFFPQGYQEHANGIVDFNDIPSSISSSILCRVLGIKYLADLETDEVYAKINLIPVPVNETCSLDDDDDGDDDIKKVVSFAKTLTPSDANNGGGFSVPRYCAETIFPKLDLNANPPLQIIHIKDVHGKIWTFRHIYRGSPKRHLLTTGWNGFVDSKNLLSGDSIVFAKDNNDEIRVGIRRKKRGVRRDQPELSSAAAAAAEAGDWNDKKVSPESVIESLNLASRGQAFEVVYYPLVNAQAFCVNALRVRRSLKFPWGAGYRCRIESENEDSSRKSWVNGTITSVEAFDPNQWKSSPWRSIRVRWDDLVIENLKMVSPWMIELVLPNISQLNLSSSQPRKKQKFNHQLSLITPPPPMFSGNLRQGFVPFNVTPAGMQGARQDPSGSLLSPSSMANYYNQIQSAGFYDSMPIFPKFSYHPGCVSIAGSGGGGGKVVTDEKEKDNSSYFYLFGIRIEKKQLAKSSSEEEGKDDDGKGNGDKGSEK